VAIAAIVSGAGGGIITLLVYSAAALLLRVDSFAAGQGSVLIGFPGFAGLGVTICWMSGRARIAMETLAAVLDSMDAAVVIL
jgi:hypothetical protein